jgi:hypothetical protein
MDESIQGHCGDEAQSPKDKQDDGYRPQHKITPYHAMRESRLFACHSFFNMICGIGRICLDHLPRV